MAEQRHNTAFVVGAILGGIAGAAVTLWTTPRSGLELRGQMMGQGDDYAPGVEPAGGGGSSDTSLSNRALGLVERAAAPLVGMRLGETANERSTETTVDSADEEIVVPVGTASGEPAPGDTGPGHVATAEELAGPVPGALETKEDEATDSGRFTAFPHGDLPPDPPR